MDRPTNLPEYVGITVCQSGGFVVDDFREDITSQLAQRSPQLRCFQFFGKASQVVWTHRDYQPNFPNHPAMLFQPQYGFKLPPRWRW